MVILAKRGPQASCFLNGKLEALKGMKEMSTNFPPIPRILPTGLIDDFIRSSNSEDSQTNRKPGL